MIVESLAGQSSGFGQIKGIHLEQIAANIQIGSMALVVLDPMKAHEIAMMLYSARPLLCRHTA
ncbi:MAG: hypothetical protein ACI4MF_06440 [Candidatus Faecivicinus sp.]